MSQIKFDFNYNTDLKNKTIVRVPSHGVRGFTANPDGSIGVKRDRVEESILPPINTDITFGNVLKSTQKEVNTAMTSEVRQLGSEVVPEFFNWRTNAGDKIDLISMPPNQKLCGSCWAISTADIIGDMHVVSGVVDFKPNLSTTWCLACYPQNQCSGGNPAQLYLDIARGGILSKHCIDYSWCDHNDKCNGAGTDHFGSSGLNDLIPNCGCYEDRDDHLRYTIQEPLLVHVDQFPSIEDFRTAVKRHIYYYGPVLGGYLVFSNFTCGAFTRVNNGVYMETGVYDSSTKNFSADEVAPVKYTGSHAVAIVGWGVAENTVIDERGTKIDMPYWYCRNSWGTAWGEGGYFKMAMYPYNQLAQFDKIVIMQTPQGNFQAGGIVMAYARDPPKEVSKGQIERQFLKGKRNYPGEFYAEEGVPVPDLVGINPGYTVESETSGNINPWTSTTTLVVILLVLILIYVLLRKYKPKILKSIGLPA